jgi:predicted metal-dependent hydrolase
MKAPRVPHPPGPSRDARDRHRATLAAKTALPDLPPYTLRESRRSRHVRLRYSVGRGLEVVVPLGFDPRRVPALLRRKQAWIESMNDRFGGGGADASSRAELPQQLTLRAVHETWSVSYHASGQRPSLIEHGGTGPAGPARIEAGMKEGVEVHGRLDLHGAAGDIASCRAALRRWLARKGQARLLPWLAALSQELRIPFWRASIRGPSTRWGSCSSHQAISVNYKLLFLPPHLVRHVFVHELCHTVHLNHSGPFWALVEQFDPAHRQARIELRDAWRYVPSWLET